MTAALPFTLVTTGAFMTVFLAGYKPVIGLWFYLAKFFVGMFYRFTDWKKNGLHYFMTEFCYFANLLLVYWILQNQVYDNHSVNLFRTVYALCNGPLPMAAWSLGDKFVPHEPQRVISLIIHLTPGILMWSVRWHLPDVFPEAHADVPLLEWNKIWEDGLTHISLAAVPYLAWMVMYFVLIFCLLDEHLVKKGHTTLYYYMMSKPKHPMTRTIGWIPEGYLRKIVYMTLHCLSIIPAIWLTGILWNSYELNTIFVMIIGVASIWFSGTYYESKLLKEKKVKGDDSKSSDNH